MKITIELCQGRSNSDPTKEGIQKNIDALSRAIKGMHTAEDLTLLTDTKYILKAIQTQLSTFVPDQNTFGACKHRPQTFGEDNIAYIRPCLYCLTEKLEARVASLESRK